MLVSSEALLRYPIPYAWPMEIEQTSGFSDTPPRPQKMASKIVLLGSSLRWFSIISPLIRILRTYRSRKFHTDALFEEREGLGRSSVSRAALHLANNAGWFVKSAPPLESELFKTGIESFVAEAILFTGPTRTGTFEWLETGSGPRNNWFDCKKCVCILFLLPSGTLEPDVWKKKDEREQQESQPDRFLPEIVKHCKDYHTRRAAVTDGISVVFLDLFPPTMPIIKNSGWSQPFYIEAYPQFTEPVSLCVACMIYREAKDCRLWKLRTRVTTVLERNGMSNFDLYTMQRDEQHWSQFLQWKSAKAVTRPLMPEETMMANRNSFTRDFLLFRSPLPIPPIPSDTTEKILSRIRLQDAIASAATSGSGGTFAFKVTGSVRTKLNTYSQVLHGVVEHDGAQSSRLCLKLYDERLFPTPCYHRDEHDLFFPRRLEKIPDRLLTYNPAEELARREESAYDRLKPFQGSLLPYSYGFHHFTLPDGHRCIGFLMELVNGVTLDESGIENLPKKVQKEFVLSVRHCLRVLRYAQIEQTDWHVGQFLVLPGAKPEVVFIDFAFALQHHDPHHTPPSNDWNMCRNRLYDVLGWETGRFRPLWFEPDENEY